MGDNTFKCFNCGGVFEKAWSDEEKISEAKDKGFLENCTPDELCVVCDDCYNIGMNSLN